MTPEQYIKSKLDGTFRLYNPINDTFQTIEVPKDYVHVCTRNDNPSRLRKAVPTQEAVEFAVNAIRSGMRYYAMVNALKEKFDIGWTSAYTVAKKARASITDRPPSPRGENIYIAGGLVFETAREAALHFKISNTSVYNRAQSKTFPDWRIEPKIKEAA